MNYCVKWWVFQYSITYNQLMNIYEISFFAIVQKTVYLTQLPPPLSKSTLKTLPSTVSFLSSMQAWVRDQLIQSLAKTTISSRQISSTVLGTAPSSFVCSFHEVKGRATLRVLGEGLSCFEEIMEIVSSFGCFLGRSGDLWLPIDPGARIFQCSPAVGEELSREPPEVVPVALML